MTIRRIESNARMSQAVAHNGLVYVSGQVAEGSDTKTQTAAIFASIERLLNGAGSSKERILSATIWLADIADVAEFNSLWEAWLDGYSKPARATVQASLVAPTFRVEVAIIAALEGGTSVHG